MIHHLRHQIQNEILNFRRLISLSLKFSLLFPDRCSVKEAERQCVNPPEFIISVVLGKDEYMVGVTCQKHKQAVSEKVKILQNEGKIPKGKVNFSGLRAVGTDCIRADPDDLIQID